MKHLDKKNCIECGKNFSVSHRLSLKDRELRKLCSFTCSGKYRGRLRIGTHISDATKRKIGIANHFSLLGKKHTEEWKKIMSKKMTGKHIWKGKIPPMKGKRQSLEVRKKLSIIAKLQGRKPIKPVGYKMSEEQKEKLRNLWLDANYRKRVMGRRKLSSFETKVQLVIDKYNLPYKFVGNGEFMIERKNPDFINTNGKKIAVEVYCTYHKNLFRGGVDKWKEERTEIFNKYGWQVIFLEENDLIEERILECLN